MASPRSPGEPIPGQAEQPLLPRGLNRARTALILMLVAALAVAAGFETWWYLSQGSGNGKVIKLVAGLDQTSQIAWEGQSRSGGVGGVAEGLLLTPNVANGEIRLKLLVWADGSERWSVDIGKWIGNVVSIQFNAKLPGGLFGLVVTDAAGKNRFLVHQASGGGFVREFDLGNGSIAGSDMRAVYRYELDGEIIGKVRISCIPDIAGSGVAEWTTELSVEPQEGAFMVKEHDGSVNLYWINEFGVEISCFKSTSPTDSSAPLWYSDPAGFMRIGETIVASEHNNIRLTAYDSVGNQIRQEPDSGRPLHAFKDTLLVGS